MSGAQAKAACIAGCVGVIAEINIDALKKRHSQGWVMEIISDLDQLMKRIREAKKHGEATSIGYHGNIVALWERLVEELDKTGELLVDLGSDQTSLHNPYNGGYYPVQLSFDEAQKMMVEDEEKFKTLVQQSLLRQVKAIRRVTGMTGQNPGGQKVHFWDYGNAFLLEASRAGADILQKEGEEATSGGSHFIYPSYIEAILGYAWRNKYHKYFLYTFLVSFKISLSSNYFQRYFLSWIWSISMGLLLRRTRGPGENGPSCD